MLQRRKDGRTEGGPVEATAADAFSRCVHVVPNSTCIYAVVEERGRDNIHRIDIPSFRHSVAFRVASTPASRSAGQSLTGPTCTKATPSRPGVGLRKALTHHNDSALATLEPAAARAVWLRRRTGDSVFGWSSEAPGFDPARKYPLIYLIHGGPQERGPDSWGRAGTIKCSPPVDSSSPR